MCLGFTTPSITGVAVVGSAAKDRAFMVSFDDPDVADAWFSPELVEFVDFGPGTMVTSGGKRYRREADGSWTPDESQ